MKDLFMQ